MEKREIIVVVLTICVLTICILTISLFSSSFVSASFDKATEHYSLTRTIYGPQEFIQGWVKIKLINERTDSLLESNFGNSIKLIDFLNKNNAQYTCLPSDCKEDYSVVEASEKTSETFTLNYNESKVIGIKLTGVLTRINYLNLTISGNAPASCENQLKIDFLADENIEKKNTKASSEVCAGKEYGCFNSSRDIEYLRLGTTPYCQKLNLSEASGYKLGTWIKGSGTSKVNMQLYDPDANRINNATCELSGITANGGEVSCSVNYASTGGEFYVCVSASSTSGDYFLIQANSNPSSLCGFYGTPIQEPATAYNIFAEKRKFDSVGTMVITNTLENRAKLSDIIIDYIRERYSGLDCTENCIIPIKISSYSPTSQSITVSNLKLDYEKTSGNAVENKFYQLTEIPAKINSDLIQLDLGYGEFGLIEDYKNKTFTLRLNDEVVFSDTITIKKVSKVTSVYPTTTAAVVPTTFIANITQENNSRIVEYKWEFGDGTNKTTTENKVTHTYNEIKEYVMRVILKDENNFFSYKTMNISVGSPKNIANITIRNKMENIANLRQEIDDLSPFYKRTINNLFNLTLLEQNLSLLSRNYNNATTEQDYINVMKNLIDLKIPDLIFTSKELGKSQVAPFLQDEEEIDLDVLSEITLEDYDSTRQSEYKRAINGWFVDYINVNLIYEEISGKYEGVNEMMFNSFVFDIDKETYSGTYYIIIKDLENILFEENYGQKKQGDYYYISSNEDERISFSTTEDVSFLDIPIFVSPAISKLSLIQEDDPVCNFNDVCEKSRGENWKNCGDCSKAGIILISAGTVILFLIVAYVVLYLWYAKKYENYLFKSKNSLYNVVNYINNGKARKMTDEEIKANLKKAGWTSEQVTYAFRKYHGITTGMMTFKSFRK